MRDLLLVLNFDDAASRTVTRKLRAERICCKIVPGHTPLADILAQEPLGLVLAGGATGDIPDEIAVSDVARAQLPVLALGDTAAALLEAMGGGAGDAAFQNAVILLRYQEHLLTRGIENGERLLQCAREWRLPEGVRALCQAEDVAVGFADETRPLYGFQFQAEPNDLESSLLLRNFALMVCGCTPWWDEDAFIARTVEEIGRLVGEGRAICAMTGGIDSGVSALLAFQALGSRLECIFVDTGLLREKESEDFLGFFRDQIGMNIIRVPAQEQFLQALSGVKDAEEKRRRISTLMHRILDETARSLGHFDAVIRGTSYHDVMFGKGSPRLMLGEETPEICPVKELFKDEIRRVGESMGIPLEIVSRQPFPGSGLAVRILGEVTPERLETLRAADAIFRQEVIRAGSAKKLWQFFAVLAAMPGEKEGAVICLRAVHASDRSLAYAARLPYDVMENVTDRILKERPEVRRVVYDLTPSGNYTGIEWQ